LTLFGRFFYGFRVLSLGSSPFLNLSMYTFYTFLNARDCMDTQFYKKINLKIKIYIDTHLFPQKIETRILGKKWTKN
jgi:hypothetical protein